MTDDTLRKGTTRCPRDKTPLHWEQFGGMRLYSVEGGGKGGLGGMSYYKARCPTCKWVGRVRRGKYTKDNI